MPKITNILHKHSYCFLCSFKIDKCFCPYPSRITGIHDACNLMEKVSVDAVSLEKRRN